eukprot:c15677_g1_i1.p1 GENE.c15677_g1_i1~~c15677_g1_i1.p1  ORF type:complete len:125 (+),score=45.32 c15677_g1_i1:382-756(+)
MYSFGVVCLEFFYFSHYYSSLQSMWLTTFRLVTLEGWHIVMFEVMDESENLALAVWAAILHCLFSFLLEILILSQLMAVMYQLFNATKAMMVSNKNAHANGKKARKQAAGHWRHLIAGGALEKS